MSCFSWSETSKLWDWEEIRAMSLSTWQERLRYVPYDLLALWKEMTGASSYAEICIFPGENPPFLARPFGIVMIGENWVRDRINVDAIDVKRVTRKIKGKPYPDYWVGADYAELEKAP